MSLFSKNLRFLRKRGGFKQEEISVLFNKQANTVGNWENGKSEPSLTELIKLSEYFRVSVQDLLNNDLESRDSRQNKGAIPIVLQSNSNRTEEVFNSPTNEGGQDAFWIILRELRLAHEKLDSLLSRLNSTSFQKYSDKSSH